MANPLKRLYRRARRAVTGRAVINWLGRGAINLIDVGSVGKLPTAWRGHEKTIHHLLKFEPRDAPEYGANVTALDTALWEREEIRDFYIYEGLEGSGSSLLQQNVDYVRANFETLKARGPRELADSWFERSALVRVEPLKCRALDDVLRDLNKPFGFHMLKVDTQGAELPILRGAENLLKTSCLAIELELYNLPLYIGIALRDEVAAYLDGFGFEIGKTYPPHGTFDSQNDTIFIKRGAAADDRKRIGLIRQVYGISG